MDQFRGKKGKQYEERHEGFQRPNPMKMTDFEESLAVREVLEREAARMRFSAGIQGRDGGSFPNRWPS
jgi:hypothetical protein